MLLPKRVLLATLMLVTGGGTASAGLTVPPPTWLPPAATAPRLWFDGGDVAVITALRARVSDPAVAGYYASFKGYVDGLLTTLLSGNTSDDTRSKVAKAAALLHVLGKTPPTGSHGYTSYAQVAFAALGAVRSRQPVNTVEKYFNPPGDAIDVLTDSSRLQSLAEAYDLLASTARTPETDAKVRGIIAQWANAVRQDWNLTGAYFVPGHRDNWGIKAGAALVTTAIALSGHGDADAWLDDGMTYLDESLDAVTSETGWFLESPWYLNYSLANLVPTAWHVKNALGLDWFGPLEPLVDAAFAVRQPDGRAPPFEEGLPNVFPWDVLAAAYPARAATMKWAWAQSPQTVANFDNEQIHTVTRFLVADTTTLPSAPTAPPTSFLGGDTRAAFLRTGWGADAFAISTMTARDTSATAAWSSRHNIQNPLDLILHARSTLLVPTSGGGPLVTRSEDRDEYLSPTSKNLPLIEGTAPFVVDASAVTFGARLDSRDAGARPQHLADLVLTEVSGYPNGGRARRVVALVDNQYAAVFDHLTVSSNQNRSLELSWRGRGQRTQVAASNQRAANRWSYGQARVQIDTTATGNLSTESNASLYADAWGQEESVSGVIVGRSGRALTLVSALQAYPSSASAMSVTTSSTSAAAAMTVSAVGGPDILVSAPGTGPASAAGVTLDGKAAIVRKTGPAAAVVDAVSLSVDGATWLVASPAATLAWTVSGDGFVVTVSPDSGASFSLDLGHTGLDLSEVYAGSVDGVPLGASQLSVDADGFHLKNVAPGTIVVGPAPCRQGSGEDPDGDRICGSADVCPTVADPGQQDSDHDGIGDACECLDAADRCDDGTPCTTDSCVSTSGECKHVPVAVATACDDQSACTSGDHCEAGACVGAPITCNDQNPCTIDGCEPATGCTATPNAGESCDDHDVCTVSDRCDGTGRCVGEVIDCDDDNPCTEDHCGSNGVCTHAAAEAGLACDDGDACTREDRCSGTACTGLPVTCDDHNPCTADACDPTVGCVAPAVPAGTACDDHRSCTLDDVCDGAVCHGTQRACDDGNPCTVDGCDEDVGCFTTPAPFGSACDDGDACTTGELCFGGECVGAAVTCDDGNGCTTDRCEPATGCVTEARVGAPCDDGSACTGGDACDDAGACVGAAVSCDDADPCTIDRCDPAAGCVTTPAAAGTACDDGDPCTIGEACGDGGCVGGAARECDDGNPCTANVCVPGTGCVATLVPNATPCTDGDACTVDDVCAGGVCRGAAAVCDDGDPCTVDACDAELGCVTAPAGDGTACDDGDACTVGDGCAAGACAGGAAVDCDDGNPCTLDGCDAGVGCLHQPVTGDVACDDGDACTTGDRCDDGGSCVGAAVACDDGDPCTVDACEAGVGCVTSTAPSGTACDDGDPCTVDDVCGVEGCAGAPKGCDDGDACTVDACLEGGACAHDVVACPAGTACEAGECVETTCGACASDGDCAEGDACVVTTAGQRCMARCDEGRACAEDEVCAAAEEGVAVCLTAEGDCAELPPTAGDDDGGGDVADGVVADEGPEDTGGPGAEVVEEVVPADEGVVEEDEDAAESDASGGDADTAVGVDAAGLDVNGETRDIRGLGSSGAAQTFSGDEGGGCSGCATAPGAPGAAWPAVIVLLALVWLRRRASS